MTGDTGQLVSVSRRIEVPAEKLFDFLAHPANHPLIDGSGMLREGSGGVISGAGQVFTMTMHNDEMGDYEIFNHVIECEPNRRIGWEPVLKAASRPEDQADIGDRSHHRWSFELTPTGLGIHPGDRDLRLLPRPGMAAQRRQGRHPLDRQHDDHPGRSSMR